MSENINIIIPKPRTVNNNNNNHNHNPRPVSLRQSPPVSVHNSSNRKSNYQVNNNNNNYYSGSISHNSNPSVNTSTLSADSLYYTPRTTTQSLNHA